MYHELRLYFLILFATGPVVALWAALRRGIKPSIAREHVAGWRWYVPSVLLPFEWLLPPILIIFGLGEIQADWFPIRVLGMALGAVGTLILVWASVLLGRFLLHEAAVLPDHVLVMSGPYRFIRHPIYTGYLALLLGSGLGVLNVWLLLLWPFSLLGILVQVGSEERLLLSKFGHDYSGYAVRTGPFLPRSWRSVSQT
jgi:protein-S-isoprenylcysteine O-methyltransferase Ste14